MKLRNLSFLALLFALVGWTAPAGSFAPPVASAYDIGVQELLQTVNLTTTGIGRSVAAGGGGGGTLALSHIGGGSDETTYPLVYTVTANVNSNTTTKRILVAFASDNTSGANATSVTVGGQALSLVAEGTSGGVRLGALWGGYFATGAPNGSVSIVITYPAGNYEFAYYVWVIDGAASSAVGSPFVSTYGNYASPTNVGPTINSTFACVGMLYGSAWIPATTLNMTKESPEYDLAANGWIEMSFGYSITTGSVQRGWIPGTTGSEDVGVIVACYG